MARSTNKSYNSNWQYSKFAGVTYSGSKLSQFENDVGYLTSVSTSSKAVSASYARSASYAVSASLSQNAITASYILQAVSSSFSTTASYAETASYSLNGGGNIDTSSLVTTSSFNQFTSSYYLDSASFSSSIASLTTSTSSYVLNSQTSSMVVLSASYADTASYVFQTISASYTDTASHVNPLVQNVEITGSLFVSNSINTSVQYLINNNGVATVKWGNNVLVDVNTSASVAWGVRRLIDANEVNSVEWNQRHLKDTNNLLSLDWQSRSGLDSNGSSSFGWESRKLEDSNQNRSVDWDLRYLYKSDGVTVTFDWENSIVNENLTISGALQLNPTNDPGGANTTSSFIFVTSSGDNTEFNLHYRNNGALWETHWLEERVDTGLVWGGVVTFSGTTMSITPGAGLIVNHNANTSSHGDTVPTYVQFGPITASAQFITSSQVTYLLIDTDGSLIQQTSIFTPQQFNEKLPLGYIFCLTTSSISSYADARTTTYGQDEQQTQFIRAFGPLKVNGYDITPQSGSLKISIASGRSYRFGGFYIQNPDNPSIYDSSNVPTGSLVRVYRDPAVVGGFRATLNGFVPFTDIDPTMWDDGSGTLQAVGANEWTIQRVFQGVVNGISYVYYGQSTYDSLNAAIQSITTEAFEESPTSILALPFIGYIIARGNTTDLGDTVNNKIINSGLFRNTAGSSGGGGVATTNLNDLADVNIVSPSTGQALVYNAGLWENNTPASASYANTASYVENAQTASYILNAISSSYASTASYIELAQSASYVLNAISSSYSNTASYIELAQSASYVLQAISASFASTASFTPNALVTASVNLDTITFTKGDGSTFPITVITTGSNTTASFTNQSTWTFNHNLGTQLVIIQAFNTNYEQIIPKSITLNGINQATITFPSNQSGYAVASLGGNSISELNKVYVVRFQATGINAADNTSYYATTLTIATTNPAVHKYTLPYDVTLVGAHITAYNITTNATNESSSVFLRLNNATDYLISNEVVHGGTVPVMNTKAVTGLSQSFSANNDIQMKWTTPTYATNPVSSGVFLDLYFYKT